MAVHTPYEQELLQIVHDLPVERILQILDFARYIQSQATEDFLRLADEDESDILNDEVQWQSQFAATQDGLKRMAERVRSEIQAGRTRSMKFTKDGGMVPE
ncbi:hypothetical protein GF339_04255 [candidate division KSB3 bacterium]|uniref:DUF2281 domain-containing protein n=1 Tax=candidate division KSB3 bacterium TaxID=2044937 RepID=A0A9D5Q511_9BACT|nr:hypothetical protein [candidate division KSB3 bacterium]MBD3323772.1 hypothetical protein [candidate division KSB3 bacterium]